MQHVGVALAALVVLAGGCAHLRVPPGGTELPDYAPERVTEADYQRAESFLGWNVAPLVDGMTLLEGQEQVIQANWINPAGGIDDRFWYVVQKSGGRRFVLVDPGRGEKKPAFDHERLAAYLRPFMDPVPVTADDLPFTTFSYVIRQDSTSSSVPDLDSIRFVDDTEYPVVWTCGLEPISCGQPLPTAGSPPVDRVPNAPMGSDTAFVRDDNLWVVTVRESVRDSIQATRDGEDKYGYGTQPQECCDAITRGWWRDGVRLPGDPPAPRPYLAWSPDGKKILTHRYDERAVPELHLLETAVPRPILHSYSYALPGDSLPTYELFAYHVEEDTLVRLDAAPMVGGFAAETFPVQWSPDSRHVFFTRHAPDYQRVELLVADAYTGEARVVVTETSETFVNLSSLFPFLPPNWKIIDEGRHVIWFSERSGWGHLYRYDVATGDLLNPITSGDWLVLDVMRVDEAGGWVYFTGLGKDPARDPYLALLYRARLDGSKIQLLTPEEAGEEPTNHAVQISPSGKFILDTHSRRDFPGRTVVRSTEGGRVSMELETTDISRLTEKGWRLPEHFTVKARDGQTDLHGFLHFPSNFDESREYPVVDFIYPGPQIGPILSRSFSVQPFGDPSALAELGFIVFAMDAMGTPQRSKAFDDADYRALASYAFPDHIAALKQLDSIYPQIDLDRVGIYGHSGGGAAAAAALIAHGEFFDVGVAGAGNHDNRSYFFAWGNKYEGGNYEEEWERVVQGRLQGRLLITYGTMDDNVHPNGSLLLINALIKNNENFDVVVFPNRSHEYMGEPYAIRRGWDYFVTHLLGAEPPWEYEIRPPPVP